MPDFYTGEAARFGADAAYTLGSSVWWTLFWALLTFFIVYSAVLLYHWFKFSMKRRVAIAATTVYFGVAAILIFVMLSVVVTLSIV